jgi:hypothetical protein
MPDYPEDIITITPAQLSQRKQAIRIFVEHPHHLYEPKQELYSRSSNNIVIRSQDICNIMPERDQTPDIEPFCGDDTQIVEATMTIDVPEQSIQTESSDAKQREVIPIHNEEFRFKLQEKY